MQTHVDLCTAKIGIGCGTHRKDLTSLAQEGQQVVRQGYAPDQGQVAVCNLHEWLAKLGALPLRHQTCGSLLTPLDTALCVCAKTPAGMAADPAIQLL